MKTIITIITIIAFVSFSFDATAQNQYNFNDMVENIAIQTGTLPVEIRETAGSRVIVETIVEGTMPSEFRAKLELIYAMVVSEDGQTVTLTPKKTTMPALTVGGVNINYSIHYRVYIPKGMKVVTETK